MTVRFTSSGKLIGRPVKYPDWIRQKVCWMRKRHFLSQKEIAASMDMPQGTVANILKAEGLGGPVSELRKARIKQYRADGLSVRAIASRVGASEFTVRYALANTKREWPRPT